MSVMMKDDIFCSSLNHYSPLITIERPTNQRDINEKCGFADKKYVKSMPDVIDYPYRATKALTSKLGLPDTCDVGSKIQTMYPHINNYFQYCSIRGKMCFVTIRDVSASMNHYNNSRPRPASNFIIFQSPWKSADEQTIYTVGELNENNFDMRCKQPFKFIAHCFEYELCLCFKNIIRQQNACYLDIFDGEWMTQFLELMPQEIIPGGEHFDARIDFDDSGLQDILDKVIIEDDNSGNNHCREKGNNGHKIEYFNEIAEAMDISKTELKKKITDSIDLSTKCAKLFDGMVIDQIYFNKCYFHSECVLTVELANNKSGEIHKFGIVFIEQGGKYIYQQLLTPYMIYYNIGLNFPLNMGIVKPATIQWWPSQVSCKYYSFLNLFFTFDNEMTPQLRSNNDYYVFKGTGSGIILLNNNEEKINESPELVSVSPVVAAIEVTELKLLPSIPALAIPVPVPVVTVKPCDDAVVVPETTIICDSNEVAVVTSADIIGMPMKRSNRGKIAKQAGQIICQLETIRESSEPPATPIVNEMDNYSQVGRRIDMEANKRKFEQTQFNFGAFLSYPTVDIVSKNVENPKKLMKQKPIASIDTNLSLINTKAASQKSITPRIIASPSVRRNRGKAGKSKENRGKQGTSNNNNNASVVSPVCVIAVTEKSTILRGTESDKDAAFTNWWNTMEGIKNSNKDELPSIVSMAKEINKFCNFYSNISAIIDQYGNIQCEHCINGNGFSNQDRLNNFWKLFNYCLKPYDSFWCDKMLECKKKTSIKLNTFDGLKLWLDKELPLQLLLVKQARDLSEDDIAAKKRVLLN